ncbi:XkdX family protein [Bacillus altitudinis]|nr:XkdX family protein [Bacillus altitudinis]MCA0923051.1 XkdX family protein [Bacillus stratosphericus]AKC65601.1 XkdX family protein [Bacillus altitudinis]MCY7498258.1 XkdX family protein [Bacillus altitudinis]MCY7535475.1 XkdX family protein [Bacillus altitudinis]MCY7545492.1 XkdX family protein [Bacillus altitudinis]
MMYPTLSDIKQFWEWKCYEPPDIAFYVDIGYITIADYEEITGEQYEA